MLAPGHLAFGVATYMALSAFYGHQPGIPDYAAVVVGALLPDIDHPRSQFGRLVPFISIPVANVFGHRGLTHSLLAVVVFMAILFQTMENFGQAAPSTVAAALCFGYLSHILADFCTISGVPLLWPYRRRNTRGFERGFRLPVFHFRTGGTFEYALTTALGVLLAYQWVY